MNDREIDDLLLQLKERESASWDNSREDAICATLHAGIRRRRRIGYSVLAILVIGIIGCGVFLRDVGVDFQDKIARLELAKSMFAESGVALVDGELTTFERQDKQSGRNLLCLQLAGEYGSVPVTFELLVGNNDFIRFKDGTVIGELLLSMCSDNSTVVEIDLEFADVNGNKQHVKDVVAVNSTGEVVKLQGNNTLELHRG